MDLDGSNTSISTNESKSKYITANDVASRCVSGKDILECVAHNEDRATTHCDTTHCDTMNDNISEHVAGHEKSTNAEHNDEHRPENEIAQTVNIHPI